MGSTGTISDTLQVAGDREKGTARNTGEGRSRWNHVPEVGDTDSKSPSTMINQSNFSGARLASIPSSKGQVYSTNYFASQVSDFCHVHKLDFANRYRFRLKERI